MSNPIPELLERVAAYDRTWVEGRPEDVRHFLHDDVVFSGENFRRLTRGVDASVKSYAEFIRKARVHSFHSSDYAVDIVGNVAVMTYRWLIDYEYEGRRLSESGHDVLVWVCQGSEWLIAWRNQLADTR